jgi:hypothetical protein
MTNEQEPVDTLREADDAHDQPKDTMSHSERQGARGGQVIPEKSASRVTIDTHEERETDSRPDTQKFPRGDEQPTQQQ